MFNNLKPFLGKILNIVILKKIVKQIGLVDFFMKGQMYNRLTLRLPALKAHIPPS